MLQGPDVTGLEVDHPDLVVVGVGHVEAGPGDAQAAGLIEAGRVVLAAGLAVAGQGLHGAGLGVGDLDLVVVGVGDEELAVAVGHAQAVLEADFRADAVPIAELEEALAHDPAHLGMVGVQAR